MEVLSVGEKIKRARIYKGYTLKDVCENEISVSKLSCIENGKVNPEDWVLEFISQKLELDITYLKQDVEEQINVNIMNLLDNNKSEEYLVELQYNLELAERYSYYNLALHIMHLIFEYMLENSEIKDIQENIGRYYDLSNNATVENKKSIYYMDIARYFYKNKEYYQAINYFRNVRRNLVDGKDKDFNMLADIIYYEASAYNTLHEYNSAYEVARKLNDLFEYVEDELKKAKMYHMMAILSLKLDTGKFEEYEAKAYDMYKDNSEHKSTAIYNFASAMFQTDVKDKAVEYVKKAVEIYPKDNQEKLVEFMLTCTSELVDNKAIEVAQELSDDVLNRAINLDNIRFIEKAYYLKSKILLERNNLISAEMYMNLSLDSLAKFGSKKEVYDRYMEMGKMYHEMDSVKESIKYFSLAMSLQKKL
ncbi:helix-turn-helix domain-containing protein [Clostridium ganghwense]|uniref:Helix-turn-helix transcriptional regulator n=1 Tax=Clostridium ganghwense TaxID=312089 RepID=A0ABT4CPH4_9CLOT|nr:helix-turn-helix transcriptional regulator [Clostridium ganghwense]MCY6370950.1 helix-turn-helix transcriptional regulator [Clostridium ganghwense]